MADAEEQKAGTYEIFAEAEHFQRHCEDWAKKERRCWKLVDTGDPMQMVANALRDWADELAPAADAPPNEDALAAVDYLEDTIRRHAEIRDVQAGEWVARHLRTLREALGGG